MGRVSGGLAITKKKLYNHLADSMDADQEKLLCKTLAVCTLAGDGKMLQLWRLLFCLLMLSLPTMAWGEEKKFECSFDAFPCWLDTISWVEVSFRGELLKKHKSDFEKLIRLRLRNDLSMIPHEVMSFDVLEQEERKGVSLPQFLNSRKVKKRGEVTCFIWTVGTDYPVAFLVECQLFGWGSFHRSPLYEKFEHKVLGYGSANSAKSQIEEAIQNAITTISADFLEAKELLIKRRTSDE